MRRGDFLLRRASGDGDVPVAITVSVAVLAVIRRQIDTGFLWNVHALAFYSARVGYCSKRVFSLNIQGQ